MVETLAKRNKEWKGDLLTIKCEDGSVQAPREQIIASGHFFRDLLEVENQDKEIDITSNITG